MAAKKLGTTRANVSMIEWRARKKLDRARQAIEVYETLQPCRTVSVEKGTKLAEVPKIVLRRGKYRARVTSGPVEIVLMVKALKPSVVRKGRILRGLEFKSTPMGKLEVSG